MSFVARLLHMTGYYLLSTGFDENGNPSYPGTPTAFSCVHESRDDTVLSTQNEEVITTDVVACQIDFPKYTRIWIEDTPQTPANALTVRGGAGARHRSGDILYEWKCS